MMRRFGIAALLALLAVFTAACELVGQGDLHVQNDQSGLGDGAILRAFEHEAGDVVPPDGMLAVAVLGGDFGRPPDFGMNGFLLLVVTDDPCPMSEGAPEVYDPADVSVVGVINVNDGSVQQMVLVADTPENRGPYWALIELTPFPDANGGHFIHRCGEVTWS
jgi:hypothetical protein